MSESRAILFLSYYFPPIHSIGVVRNYQLAVHLRKFFSRVLILTTSNRRLLPADPLSLEGLTVFSIPTLDYRTLGALRNRRGGHFKESTKRSLIVKSAIKLINTLPFNLLIGEGGFLYSLASYFKAVKLIKQEKVGYVYSSFRPYSDHFTAYLLKLRFPAIYWIADFRDLHIEPIYRLHYFTWSQRWMNGFLLKKANTVTTVSEGLAEHLRPFNKNVYVLRNGFSFNEVGAEVNKYQKFTIVYTGSLTREENKPDALFKALKGLIVA